MAPMKRFFLNLFGLILVRTLVCCDEDLDRALNFISNMGQSMSITWATDLHFDMADTNAYKAFKENVIAKQPSVLLLAGDIANSTLINDYLSMLSRDFSVPIYFVLGNHDYYLGSIRKVRDAVQALAKELPRCHYLSRESVVRLTPQTALIGHDGWADGKAGDYEHSEVLLRDYFEIQEFQGLSKTNRLQLLHALGQEAADKIRIDLEKALEEYSNVILLTHVPPFVETCLYQGEPSRPEWSPHFVSKAVGDVILEIMSKHPQQNLAVLCGHSHHQAHVSILPNLTVIVGGAEYGTPMPQAPFLLQ